MKQKVTKTELYNILKNLLGYEFDSWSGGKIFNNTIGIFESDCKRGTDFYYVTADYDTKDRGFWIDHTKLDIYRLSGTKLREYSKYPKVELKSTNSYGNPYVKYDFPLSEFELAYTSKIQEVKDDLEGEDQLYSKMNMRDGICVKLKIPFSSKEWINNLILEAIEREKKLINKTIKQIDEFAR